MKRHTRCPKRVKHITGLGLGLALAAMASVHANAGVDSKPLLDQVLNDRKQASTPAPTEASLQDPLTVKLLEQSREETFQSWSLLCRTLETGNDCFLSQTLVDDRVPDGKMLLQISAIDENGVRGHVMLPTGFLLQDGVTIRVGQASLQFPLLSCIPEGCVADIRFNNQQVALLQTNNQVDIAIVLQSGEAMHFPFKLQGFQSALQKMSLVVRP
jgi:invasion protein IalB